MHHIRGKLLPCLSRFCFFHFFLCFSLCACVTVFVCEWVQPGVCRNCYHPKENHAEGRCSAVSIFTVSVPRKPAMFALSFRGKKKIEARVESKDGTPENSAIVVREIDEDAKQKKPEAAPVKEKPADEERPVEEKKADEHPAEEPRVEEQPQEHAPEEHPVEEPAPEEKPVEQAVTEEKPVEQSAEESMPEEKPVEEPAPEEKPVEEEHEPEEHADEHPAEEKPAEEPSAEEPAPGEPKPEEKPAEEPAPEEKPVEERVHEEKPVEEEHEPEERPDEHPAEEKPAEEPSAEEPAPEEPAPEEPAPEEKPVEEPAPEEKPVEEERTDEQLVEEPAPEEPAPEERADEQPAEEAAVEEQPAPEEHPDEPAGEEHAEEHPVEEKPAEEPVPEEHAEEHNEEPAAEDHTEEPVPEEHQEENPVEKEQTEEPTPEEHKTQEEAEDKEPSRDATPSEDSAKACAVATVAAVAVQETPKRKHKHKSNKEEGESDGKKHRKSKKGKKHHPEEKEETPKPEESAPETKGEEQVQVQRYPMPSAAPRTPTHTPRSSTSSSVGLLDGEGEDGRDRRTAAHLKTLSMAGVSPRKTALAEPRMGETPEMALDLLRRAPPALLEWLLTVHHTDALIKCHLNRERRDEYVYFTFVLDELMMPLMLIRKRARNSAHAALTLPDDARVERPLYLLRHNRHATEFALQYADKSRPGDLAAVRYMLSDTDDVPRALTILLPTEECRARDDLVNLLRCYYTKRSQDKYLVYQNKAPVWREEMKSNVLNFGGRVKVSSTKNFQMVAPDNVADILMQFGRVSQNSFILDFKAPLCPLQALAVALSSFN